MKTPARLEQALHKLYTAYHSDQLNPECCNHCAVGNICDNTDRWKHLTDAHGSLILNYVGMVNQRLGRKINGYTPLELLQIEAEFLKGCGFELPLKRHSLRPDHPRDKETLFKGLCAAVAFLCQIDGVTNVMDYTTIFERASNKSEVSQPVLT